MKEERERLLKYIGEIYDRHRLEEKEQKKDDDQHDDIVKAGKKIRKIREQKKMTVEELSALTGLVPSYISAIEIGEADPYMTEINDITKALGIELSTLFEKQ